MLDARHIRLSRQAYQYIIIEHMIIWNSQRATRYKYASCRSLCHPGISIILAGTQERRIKRRRLHEGYVCGESRTRLEFNIWRRRNTKILHTKYRERIGLSCLRYAHCISRSASRRVSRFSLSLTERGSAEAPPLRSWFTSLCEGCHQARVSSSGGHYAANYGWYERDRG